MVGFTLHEIYNFNYKVGLQYQKNLSSHQTEIVGGKQIL